MACRLFRLLKNDIPSGSVYQIRHGHWLRGKPPGEARTIKQRLDELNAQDPEIAFKVDIGFKVPQLSRKEATTIYHDHIVKIKNDPEIERKARNKELWIDSKELKKDWQQTSGPNHIKQIADHYGVYDDLFGDAYFYPTVPLDIHYDIDDDKIGVVYRGNFLKPNETKNEPTITWESNNKDDLWTLLLTTPDGNFTDKELEYCHWFIGNIPGNDLSKGDLLMPYMRPIPPHGIGYCRYIFVLYKQNKKIDFNEYKMDAPCLKLENRNWSTKDFYKKYEDIVTPAGLSFYQADWDESLKDFYYNQLQMKMPMYEYDFPAPYIRPQEWFPKGRPFNIYLDKYRDPRDVNKDYLLKKLKEVHPFRPPKPPLKYPAAHAYPKDMPSWLKTRETKDRNNWGRINEIK
ncbi:hypothetical protein HCN44_001135 [Aphidius gifuensis]|uniref:Large ribosomal subunit protein mL38 n=1 Tax=Aphidius gifuensis TaxID=684658 RepID=A0A835CLT3_APHGI|nr:39S ribosomal protein L38, mitochondrial [Aphidius gifuensis]KAF7988562.1 hypothetical protein HCN44_001135 [Aphidius gifuensis]